MSASMSSGSSASRLVLFSVIASPCSRRSIALLEIGILICDAILEATKQLSQIVGGTVEGEVTTGQGGGGGGYGSGGGG